MQESPGAELVELMGTFAFDCIWACCLEHRAIEPKEIYSLIQACRLSGKDAIIRVKPKNNTEVLWLLESGARGIMLPRVLGLEDVQEVVAAMKFPPLGRRGYDGLHADAGFGRTSPAEFLAKANNETFLIAQIEDVEVLPQIDALAALPGVDILFVGPADLSLSLGRHGDMENPKLQAVIRQVAAACRKHGKVAGIPATTSQIAGYHALGYRFFNVLTTQKCVVEGLKRTCADLQALPFLHAGQSAESATTPIASSPLCLRIES